MREMAPEEGCCDEFVQPGYFRLLLKLQRDIQILREEGVQVEDPSLGVLDFPAVRGGEQILLCWKVGEPTLCHWHQHDEDHDGRRPLEDGELWD
jgi:hypothetical protein